MYIDTGHIILNQIKTEKKPQSKEQMIETYLKFKDHGRANEKGITEKDVDPKELARGIEVEMEHTTDKETAKRISLDHLAELKDYYTRLDKMEEEGKKAGAELKKDETKNT